LGKTVAVSFEGKDVKILHSSLKGNTLSIIKSEIIAEEEFDDYLSNSKVKEFLVSYNFIESMHDTITVPPVKAKFLDKVIESKIRKTTNRNDLTYITFTIGEQITGNRKELEIYFFGVPNDELNSVIDRFLRHDKIVKAIYPSLFSAAALIKRSFNEEPVLGALNTGNENGVFFMKKGNINFIRNYDSTEAALTDFDIQNINMTINYCFQSLRTNPSSVLILGGLTGSSEITSTTISPLASFCKPDDIQCSREIFSEFLLPIASVYASKESNIMSRDFRNIYALRSYMTYAAMLFIVIAVLALGFSFYKGSGITDKRSNISAASMSLNNVDNIYAEYQEKTENVNRLLTMVDYMNEPSPDLVDLLIKIGSISSSKITFKSIEGKMDRNNMFIVTIKGTSSIDSYASLQTAFDEMLGTIKGIKNTEIKSSALNISNQSFSVELQYKKSA
jgi:hypothetical protein